MSNFLKEILDMVAMPYHWIDEERATFTFNNKKFGIFIDYQTLRLKNGNVSIANISFGIIKSSTFNSADDLDTSITNFGKPRTVFSTIAEACINNEEVVKCDIISLASSDQARRKRSIIYSVALSEIRSKVKVFSLAKDIEVTTANGSKVILLSKISFSDEDKELISSELGINK